MADDPACVALGQGLPASRQFQRKPYGYQQQLNMLSTAGRQFKFRHSPHSFFLTQFILTQLPCARPLPLASSRRALFLGVRSFIKIVVGFSESPHSTRSMPSTGRAGFILSQYLPSDGPAPFVVLVNSASWSKPLCIPSPCYASSRICRWPFVADLLGSRCQSRGLHFN